MLRDYQEKLIAATKEALTKHDAVLSTCPTGGGKTHMISHMANYWAGQTVIQAHRQELVYQICMALARDGINHRILAPDSVSNYIIHRQLREFNRSFVSPQARHTVVSVDTLIARHAKNADWLPQVRLVQTDEGHHCLPENKWGKALDLFPNAKRLGWTATAGRADRRALAGCFRHLVQGPTTRELLERGHLCRYRVFGPPPSIALAGVNVSAGGDFSPTGLREAAHKSTICGDMVSHYLKLIPGAISIAFLVDTAQAKETAERFQQEGVPAVWMSAKETDDRTRVGNLEALARGDIKVICNVDLLGEGVDVPRVEAVLDGRPTKSLPRYLQVFGRLLRNYPGKQIGTYLDLVGNVVEHGLPDAERVWSLEGAPKRERTEHDEAALKACVNCFHVFERFKPVCPACGHRPVPQGRDRPEQVDGDLTEYSPELVARLRGEADRIMGPPPDGAARYGAANWNARAQAQTQLRQALSQWAGVEAARGRELSEIYRLFWHRFGIDEPTAKTLGRTQAAELTEKIWDDINNICRRPKMPVQAIVPADDESKWSKRASPGEGCKFIVSVRHNGKYIHLGRYRTKEEAEQVENEYRTKHGLPEKRNYAKHGDGGKITASVRHNGKPIYLGKYQTKEEAEQVENEYRTKHGLPEKIIKSPKGKGGRFRAQIWHKGKDIHIGIYQTKEEAEQAKIAYKRKHGII